MLLLLVSFIVGTGLLLGGWLLLGPSGSERSPSEPVTGRGDSAQQPAAAEAPVSSTALPRQGDLTFGGEGGEVLIGLTLRPGRPGVNEILVYVLPLEGKEAAAGLGATLSLGGRSVPMESCGATCRRSETELRGGEQVTVHVGGPNGGTDVFEIPNLPAPEGSALLDLVQDRMHALRTFRFEGTFSFGRGSVRSSYAFQAPDRTRIEGPRGRTRILIGSTEYVRASPRKPWRRERGLKNRVPWFLWDGRRVVAPGIVGEEPLAGTGTTILSFYGPTGNIPIWFRLWVDPEGLVHRAEMRAQGHFMDHRYVDFDAAFAIEPPATD